MRLMRQKMEIKMKRITSMLLLITTVFLLFSAVGCSKKDSAPEGMQLAKGGADDAYSFYVPEEWEVANLGNVACAYASRVDTTSMTFTEAKKPEGTVREYFEDEKLKFPYEITVTLDGESCSFGNADKLALRYVYTYAYKDVEYTCMQIFVENGGHFYIFTYTANNKERDQDKTYYEFYLDKVTATIDAFVFNDNQPIEGSKTEYEKDADGFILVSDKRIAGFSMYVPESYTVDYSSALVSVSRGEVNITMSESTYPASNVTEYWNKRKEDLEAIVDRIPAQSGEGTVSSFKWEIDAPVKVDGGNADDAIAHEYSYILDGKEYRVYQVLLRKGTLGGKVYVFTYTASPDAYSASFEEMKTIFGKIEF